MNELADELVDWRIKDSTSWYDLPFEMREMIIDEMDAKTRCRFARCSKQCEKEAKESNYYAYAINLYMSKKNFNLDLQYGNVECPTNAQSISFRQLDNSKTLVVFQREYEEVVSSKSLTKIESGPPLLVRAKYAKEYIDKYKNSIRKFDLEDSQTNDINLRSWNLNNLNKLEECVIAYLCKGDVEVARLNKLIDINKLFEIKTVCMMTTIFEFDQILKFNGSFASLKSRKFDDQNALQFLRMWRDEEIHENVKKRMIYFNEVVNVERIAQSLGVFNFQYQLHLGFMHKYTFDCKSKNNRIFHVMMIPDTMLEINWI